MNIIDDTRSTETIEAFCSLPGDAALTPDAVERHGADAHLLAMSDDSRPLARLSLWWSSPPAYAGHRPGIIGHYASTGDAGVRLLNEACKRLTAVGCTIAIGPMDGNTWRRYRLITERGREPAFFLEPDNPDVWPQHFTTAGFRSLATYFSALNPDLKRRQEGIGDVKGSIAERGISIRPVVLERFEQELRGLFDLSLACFKDNLLYQPIGEDEFLAMYLPIERYVWPETLLLAIRDNRPVGYVFGVPDMLQSERHEPVDTIIVKTVAVDPQAAGIGLGTVLVAECQDAALGRGCRRAIHALIQDDNVSGRISSHYARPIRRYTLFARPL